MTKNIFEIGNQMYKSLKLILLSAVLSYAFTANAQVQDRPGCLDCFNFVAPTILGAENVNPAEVGLIVYDSYYNSFRAYTNTGAWQKLSNESSARTVTGVSSAALTVADDLVLINGASTAVSISLPSAGASPGKVLNLKKTDSTANLITINPLSGQLIDGVASKHLATMNENIKLVSDGTNWQITERRIPSEWVSFTPTGSWTSGVTYTGKWKRNGDSMEIQYLLSITGGVTAATLSVDFPAGYPIDASKLVMTNSPVNNYLLGEVQFWRSGSTYNSGLLGKTLYYGTTSFQPQTMGFSSPGIWPFSSINNTAPWTWANNDKIIINIKVPISGWEG